MKLAEALIIRADLQKRAAQLEERIVKNMQVQEGEQPSEDPRALLQEFMEIIATLDTLLPRIHRANVQATLPTGQTLTDALSHRDLLDLKLRVLRRAATSASERQTRYSNSEVRMVAVIPAREVQKLADELAKERRELEVLIQQANWLIDIES